VGLRGLWDALLLRVHLPTRRVGRLGGGAGARSPPEGPIPATLEAPTLAPAKARGARSPRSVDAERHDRSRSGRENRPYVVSRVPGADQLVMCATYGWSYGDTKTPPWRPPREHEPHRHEPEGIAYPPPGHSSHRQPCVAELKSRSARRPREPGREAGIRTSRAAFERHRCPPERSARRAPAWQPSPAPPRPPGVSSAAKAPFPLRSRTQIS